MKGPYTLKQLRDDEDGEASWINIEHPLMFTGLHDKNGAEIYEGFILSSEYPQEGNKNCHPVFWGNGSWCVDHKTNDCCKPWRGDLAGHHRSEKVIGNIYQNPELLKV